jgi:hypothetical protein
MIAKLVDLTKKRMDIHLYNANTAVYELAVMPNCLCMLDTLSRVVLLCVLARLIIVVVITPHNPQSKSGIDGLVLDAAHLLPAVAAQR